MDHIITSNVIIYKFCKGIIVLPIVKKSHCFYVRMESKYKSIFSKYIKQKDKKVSEYSGI